MSPTINANETLAALRTLRLDVPVLLSSGNAEPDVPIEPGDGAVAFIQKPYRQAELLERIQSLLAGD